MAHVTIPIPDDDGEQDSNAKAEQATESASIFVNCRFAQAGFSDILGVRLPPSLTVRAFKSQLVALDPTLANRKLRLIYLGRILTDGVYLAPFLTSLLQRQARQKQDLASDVGNVATSILNTVAGTLASTPKESKGKGKEREIVDDRPGQSPATAVWLNASVGEIESPKLPNSEHALPPESPEIAQTPNVALTGFDRLQEAGFSAEDIANMRTQFRNRLDNANVEHGPVADDEDEHARALESAWMEGLGNQEMATADPLSSGEYTTIFKGICIGFFLPILPLFWFRTAVFNKRMQMGVVAGTVMNMLFGLLRLFA